MRGRMDMALVSMPRLDIEFDGFRLWQRRFFRSYRIREIASGRTWGVKRGQMAHLRLIVSEIIARTGADPALSEAAARYAFGRFVASIQHPQSLPAGMLMDAAPAKAAQKMLAAMREHASQEWVGTNMDWAKINAEVDRLERVEAELRQRLRQQNARHNSRGEEN